MKKVLALVLAFAMMFSTITVAFAEATVGPEAKALADINALQGTDGVTVEYLAKAPTRLQAAIMLLRLKGLEEDAKKFVSEDNFADVKDYAWAEGKNIMAYLKANPAVGYKGTDKGFEPAREISAKEFYKVLLVSLGYVEGSAEVVGDFTWDTVAEKAKEVGLGKVLDVATFTNNDMAIATVEALKLKVKDSQKTLIEALVEAGKVDKAKAIAAGLLEDKPVVTAALKSAVALGNTVVEVTFDAAINEGATDAALYTIEGLEVKGAVVAGEKVVRLETAAQTAGTKYTLVVGDVKVNFGGKAKVAGAPELKSVTGPDTETVELVFDKTLDFASATDVANYAIKDVTVEKAELDVDTVTLTTKGLTANKTHTVKVTGVKSVDGAALKSASKSFYAKSDKNAPKLEKVEVDTYTRITAIFNEKLDKASAEDMANYTIKAGTSELGIEKIEYIGKNDDTEKYEVEITTAAQKQGTGYELIVNGVKDASVLGNAISKDQKIRFSGKMQDKNGPTLGDVTVLTRNRVMVAFNDASRLDFATLTDSTNYEFNKDVTVEKVEMIPAYDADSKEVIVTVSDLAEKTIYKLTVVGAADEYGNELKKTERSINYVNNDLNAAKILKVYSNGANEIKIVFDKHLDPATAKDVSNYTVNGDLGTPISAKINSSLKTVTLKTNDQVEGKTYKVSINGVMDLAGNVLKLSNSFVARTFENDIEAPEIQDIVVVNRKVMRVTFTEPVVVNANIKAVVKKANGDAFATFDIKAVYDDNQILEFSTGTDFDNIEYKLTGFNDTVLDKAGNISRPDAYNFWGDNSKPENIEFSWEQVNVQEYKFTFTEKVTPLVGNMVDDEKDDLGMDTVWYWTKNVRPGTKAFEGDINSMFQGAHAGINIANLDTTDKTTITADITDEEAPYITDVKAVYRNRVEITFSEELKSAGTYTIKYYDNAGKEKSVVISSTGVVSTNKKVVRLGLGTTLESRFEYTLKVISEAQDLAGNKSEKNQEYYFMGTDLVAAGNYIQGVEVLNGQRFDVVTNVAIAAPVVTVTEKDADGKFTIVVAAVYGVNANNDKIEVTLQNTALRQNVTYKVTVDGMEYEFDGIVKDTVSYYEEEVAGTVYYVIDYSNMKLTDTVLVNGANATITKVDPNKDDLKCTIAKSGAVETITVKRDGIVLYFYVAEGKAAVIVP